MSKLRDNSDGTCNCRSLGGNSCFFTDGLGGPCDCKCHRGFIGKFEVTSEPIPPPPPWNIKPVTGIDVRMNEIMANQASMSNGRVYPLLEKAPAHDTLEFIDYLRKNNVVVQEDDMWILIENCKYHTPEKPWYTLFAKQSVDDDLWNELRAWFSEYIDWEWRKKRASDQTVKRFHIHLIK